MPPVTIYTTPTCPYCRCAKNLLARKGVSFEEIDASDPSAREAMIERAAGSYTVPQVFIGSRILEVVTTYMLSMRKENLILSCKAEHNIR